MLEHLFSPRAIVNHVHLREIKEKALKIRYNLGSIASVDPGLSVQLRQGVYLYQEEDGCKIGSSYCLLFVGARCFLMSDHALVRNNRPNSR